MKSLYSVPEENMQAATALRDKFLNSMSCLFDDKAEVAFYMLDL
jgi:hypothetical protein